MVPKIKSSVLISKKNPYSPDCTSYVSSSYALIFVFFLLLVFVDTPLHADEPRSLRYEILRKEKRFEDTKRQIRDEKNTVKVISRREGSILDEMERIDRVLVRNSKQLKNIEANIKGILRNIRGAKKTIKPLTERQQKLSRLLEQRLIAMYKMRDGGEIRVILSSSSTGDMERRYRYMTAIIDNDAKLIEDYRRNISSLNKEIQRLKKLQSEKTSLKKAKIEKLKETKLEKKKRLTLLAKVRREKVYRLQALKELEGASKELQKIISDLKGKERPQDSTVGFAAMRGVLPMPVEGNVVSYYGKVKHPRFKTITFSNGIFIKAPLEAKIKSVYDGKVIYTGWLKGYGQVLIIDHGGGFYTLFAHLSKILKRISSRVEVGDVVALVGDTGSLKGSGLYFEVRQNGIPRDPMGWIANR
jgi:septal ring factor EnvC (AmiA/AmiB activator)